MAQKISPSGRVFNFPDGTPDEVMDSFIANKESPQYGDVAAEAAKLRQELEAPYEPEEPEAGFVDAFQAMGYGAVEGLGRSAQGLIADHSDGPIEDIAASVADWGAEGAQRNRDPLLEGNWGWQQALEGKQSAPIRKLIQESGPTVGAILPAAAIALATKNPAAAFGANVERALGSKIAGNVAKAAIPGVATRASEAAMEKGFAYDEALGEGKDKEEALRIGNRVFKANMPLAALDVAEFAMLMPILDKVPGMKGLVQSIPRNMFSKLPTNVLKLAANALMEGQEEVAQEEIQKWAKGEGFDPWVGLSPAGWLEHPDSFYLGAMTSLIPGGAGIAMGKVINDRADQMNKANQDVFKKRVLDEVDSRKTTPRGVEGSPAADVTTEETFVGNPVLDASLAELELAPLDPQVEEHAPYFDMPMDDLAAEAAHDSLAGNTDTLATRAYKQRSAELLTEPAPGTGQALETPAQPQERPSVAEQIAKTDDEASVPRSETDILDEFEATVPDADITDVDAVADFVSKRLEIPIDEARAVAEVQIEKQTKKVAAKPGKVNVKETDPENKSKSLRDAAPNYLSYVEENEGPPQDGKGKNNKRHHILAEHIREKGGAVGEYVKPFVQSFFNKKGSYPKSSAELATFIRQTHKPKKGETRIDPVKVAKKQFSALKTGLVNQAKQEISAAIDAAAVDLSYRLGKIPTWPEVRTHVQEAGLGTLQQKQAQEVIERARPDMEHVATEGITPAEAGSTALPRPERETTRDQRRAETEEVLETEEETADEQRNKTPVERADKPKPTEPAKEQVEKTEEEKLEEELDRKAHNIRLEAAKERNAAAEAKLAAARLERESAERALEKHKSESAEADEAEVEVDADKASVASKRAKRNAKRKAKTEERRAPKQEAEPKPEPKKEGPVEYTETDAESSPMDMDVVGRSFEGMDVVPTTDGAVVRAKNGGPIFGHLREEISEIVLVGVDSLDNVSDAMLEAHGMTREEYERQLSVGEAGSAGQVKLNPDGTRQVIIYLSKGAGAKGPLSRAKARTLNHEMFHIALKFGMKGKNDVARLLGRYWAEAKDHYGVTQNLSPLQALNDPTKVVSDGTAEASNLVDGNEITAARILLKAEELAADDYGSWVKLGGAVGKLNRWIEKVKSFVKGEPTPDQQFIAIREGLFATDSDFIYDLSDDAKAEISEYSNRNVSSVTGTNGSFGANLSNVMSDLSSFALGEAQLKKMWLKAEYAAEQEWIEFNHVLPKEGTKDYTTLAGMKRRAWYEGISNWLNGFFKTSFKPDIYGKHSPTDVRDTTKVKQYFAKLSDQKKNIVPENFWDDVKHIIEEKKKRDSAKNRGKASIEIADTKLTGGPLTDAWIEGSQAIDTDGKPIAMKYDGKKITEDPDGTSYISAKRPLLPDGVIDEHDLKNINYALEEFGYDIEISETNGAALVDALYAETMHRGEVMDILAEAGYDSIKHADGSWQILNEDQIRTPQDGVQVDPGGFRASIQTSEGLTDEEWAVMEEWYRDRDDAGAEAGTSALVLQKRIKKLAGEKSKVAIIKTNLSDSGLYFGKAAKDLDRALHIAIDLRRHPDHITKYWDKLSPRQRELVKMAQEVEKDPAKRELANLIEEHFYLAGIEAEDAGLIGEVQPHYVARVWSDSKGLPLHPNHAKQRKFGTVLEGWANGYTLRIEGATNNYAILREELLRQEANRRLMRQGMRTMNKDGNYLLTHRVPKDKRGQYTEVRSAAFGRMVPRTRVQGSNIEKKGLGDGWETNEWVVVNKKKTAEKGKSVNVAVFNSEKAAKDKMAEYANPGDYVIEQRKTLWDKVPIYAVNDMARRLNAVMAQAPSQQYRGVKYFLKGNAIIKSWVLATSLFHHLAFMRSFYFGTGGLNPLAPITDQLIDENGKKFGKWRLVKAYESGIKMIEQLHPEVHHLLRHGLTIGKIQDWDSTILADRSMLEKKLEELGHNKAAGWVAKVTELRERQTNFLFKRFGAALKVQAALLEYRRELEINKKTGARTNEEIARQIAQLMNEDFGGLHFDRMGVGQGTREGLRAALLAPDWTGSNILTIKRMVMPGRGLAPLKRKLDEGGKPKDWSHLENWEWNKGAFEGMPEQRKMYGRFWAGIAMRGVFWTTLMNLALSLFDEEDDDRWRGMMADGFSRMHWAEADITPIYRVFRGSGDGHSRRFSLLGHFMDPVKWMFRLPESVKHKSSPMVRYALEFASGTDWKGDPFTSIWEITGTDDAGYYKTDGPGYRAGDPKGGKFFGHMTRPKGAGGASGGLSNAQIPTFLLHSAFTALPLQVPETLGAISGELDWFDAMSRNVGLHVRKVSGDDYSRIRDEVEKLDGDILAARRAGNTRELQKLRRENKNILATSSRLKATESAIRRLNALMKTAEAKKDDKKAKMFEERIKEMEQRFVKNYRRRVGA